jgi:hypothetical protein
MKHLLNQTLTLYTSQGKDKYGRQSYTTSSTVKGRFQKKTITRVLPNQQVVTVEATAYIPSNTNVSRGDRITYGSVDYEVFNINEAIGRTGNTHHIKLELTKWK